MASPRSTGQVAARDGLDYNSNALDEEDGPASALASPGDILASESSSPLSRAGLLQPRSFAPSSIAHSLVHRSNSHSTAYSSTGVYSRTQDDIRASTLHLSNMLLSGRALAARRASASASATDSAHEEFIFPAGVMDVAVLESDEDAEEDDIPSEMLSSQYTERTDASTSTAGPSSSASVSASASASHIPIAVRSGSSTPRGAGLDAFSPSGLSILLSRPRGEGAASTTSSRAASAERGVSTVVPTPVRRPLSLVRENAVISNDDTSSLATPIARAPSPPSPLSESTALLDHLILPSYVNGHDTTPASALPSKPKGLRRRVREGISRARGAVSKDSARETAVVAAKSLPAVLLGSLLNILDGVSYGMIIFPTNEIFTNFGGIGVSMFFVTTMVSQLVYSCGGSGFVGANGSMMIEVVPFFHILAAGIASEIGEDKPAEIISTTIMAFALSSVLTGLTFFLLGALKLGVLIGFFPRHILVGCIGGVGVFLIETGLAVCARIDDDDFTYSLETLKFFLGNTHVLALWLPAFALAVLLRAITHRWQHQLIFPVYFITIPVLFYIFVGAARIDIPTLRADGWVFDMGGSSEPWYKFYSYFDIKRTNLRALWVTLPTQFALLFFNILHPPLNVPALAVSLNEDVDTNKELIAHGYSNLLAGFLGTVPNYLVYVNTLLFYRVGGNTRLSGVMLAIFTFLLLIIGTGPIGYIPIMVVGALIFVLGIDLVKEALWDTRHRVSRFEYITIASIMVCMTLWDFVIGVLFGIVVSCFFFVVQNSQTRSIRAFHTGEASMSAVRRPSAHREYIREVAKQTTILKLQGFLFFGTITRVEEAIRKLVDLPQWQHNPIRFLVIDLSLVVGVDMSSAEAFVRVQRLLSARSVTMVFSGFAPESSVGKALKSVGLLEADFVEVFASFNDAMEWTENAYLRAWFVSQKAESDNTIKKYHALPGRQNQKNGFALGESFANSPRRVQIYNAAGRTIANDDSEYPFQDDTPDPFLTLTKAFSSYGDLDREMFQPLVSYLKRMAVPEGLVLWNQGDASDGLYLIESGVLRATYKFANHTDGFEESMVGGTLAGELSALSDLPRNATVFVERQAVLWKLSIDDLRRLEFDHPALARAFSRFVLKAAKMDYDILLSALAARQ